MIEGAIFFVLAVTGIRYALVRLIPEPIRLATPAGIGAFLAHLGLQTAEGLGVVVADTATAVTLGACPVSKRTYIVAYTPECQANPDFCLPGDAYTCDVEHGVMTSATTWIGILGAAIILVMLAYKKRSAFIMGIGFVTIVSWFRDSAVTYFPMNDDIGDARFDYFQKVVSVEKLDMVLAPFTNDLSHVGVALFTFLYTDFLDTSGTLLGIVSAMGFVDENGDFPNAREAYASDALATMFGAIFGTSPVTSYIESGAGVEAGARTGLTAIFVAFFFFLSIFFAPILASVPPFAVGGALVIVGALMCHPLAKVKWYDVTHAVTAFVVVMVMPLTYSIAYGLIAGLMSWTVLQSTFYVLSLVGIKKPEAVDPLAATAANTQDDKKENVEVPSDPEQAVDRANEEEDMVVLEDVVLDDDSDVRRW
mmetsp:Transcript_20322/g.38498  ORF Transcript_20322/g.38498 Transcript_20322/m.38498 type:complete len:422 (+) Transcript_20322:907-2172(+)